MDETMLNFEFNGNDLSIMIRIFEKNMYIFVFLFASNQHPAVRSL